MILKNELNTMLIQNFVRRLPLASLALAIVITGSLVLPESLFAQGLKKQNEYYTIKKIPVPADTLLEVGAMTIMPDGRLAVSSRRGDIYMFADPLRKDIDNIESKLFAQGLHEVLGMAYRDNSLYATQRGEISRLIDANRDGFAERIETVTDEWGIDGDYHEYAFGSQFDEQGNMWVALCLTGSFTSENKYRGWCVRVSPDGTVTPTCSGLRSPGGIGFNTDGACFYTDNQGPWNGTCTLKWLKEGSFQGNPVGLDWFSEPKVQATMGEQPEKPKSGSRIMTEAERIPQLEPPAIMFPYKKLGQSASGILCDTSDGKFGPFQNQMFVGDQTFSWVMRVDLQKVNGHYQGAAFPFCEGFDCGTLAMAQGENGAMFVGGTNRGWGSRGTSDYSLERLEWTGKVPFEVLTMKVNPDGFDLTFTKPVDPQAAGDVTSYRLPTYTYIYQKSYGSPEVDATTATIKEAIVSEDGRSVRLVVEGLQIGHVHELHMDGIRSKEDQPLWHPVAYYTLNYLPSE